MMEGIDDAISAKPTEPSTQTPLVSSMTTVTPITTQIVDDFRSDGEWEITPLEKASLDCTDNYIDPAIDNSQQQAENGKSEDDAGSQDEVVTQDDESQDMDDLSQGDDSDVVKLAPRPEYLLPTQTTYDKLPKQKKSDTKQILEQPDVKIPENTYKSTDTPKESRSELTDDTFPKKISCDPAIKFLSRPDTNANSADDQSRQNSDNKAVLSQSSSDLQKMIELGAELRSGQECSQVMSTSDLHVIDDKEKALENIQREIIGERNPMEMMAEVASKQENIKETHHIDGSSSHINKPPSPKPGHETDLKPSQANVPEPDLAANVEIRADGTDVVEVTVESNEDVVSIDKGDHNSIHDSIQMEIERETTNAQQETSKHKLNQLDEPKKQSQIIEETIEIMEAPTVATAGDLVAEIQAEPLVEEASSADELEPMDTAVLKVPEEPVPPATVIDEPPPSRRSGRKAKPVTKLEEQPKQQEGRRTSRGGRKLKNESVVAQESCKEESETNDVVDVPDPNQQEADGANMSSKPDENEEESQIVSDTPDELSKHAQKESSEKEKLQEEPVLEEEKPQRSMRARAPKRKLEEDSPKSESTQKHVKRARKADDCMNKSYEAAKNTPSIKLPVKSRQTISTSAPVARHEISRPSFDYGDGIRRRYQCDKCKYSTDRLNNITFHHRCGGCPGASMFAEEQKAHVIRQQQTPKGNKRNRYGR